MSQTTTGVRKARGQTTRRRFTFSEPTPPAELAQVQETYHSSRHLSHIPNQAQQASVQEREYAAYDEREHCALKKGRSLPQVNRTKKGKRMADLFNSATPSHLMTTSLTTKTRDKAKTLDTLKLTPKPRLTDPSTPTRWAGGAFENSPPPSSLPIPVFSDDEDDCNDDDLICGATSSDGEPDDGLSTVVSEPLSTRLSHAPEPRHKDKRTPSRNPNQHSPPPAENQPRSMLMHSRSKSSPLIAPRSPLADTSTTLPSHEQQFLPSTTSQHPVFMFSHSVATRPGFYFSPPAAPTPTGGSVLPSSPQPSRDLDQLSNDLRKMLGISVST